jgi:phytoene dehydrogenase-like protein
MTNKVKFLVIGAGIAGLHIGALLSSYGKVLILEKSNYIGGRARVVDIDGFELDYGPHPVRFGPNSALGISLNEIKKPIRFIKPGASWAFLSDGTKSVFPTGSILAIKRSKMVPFFKTLKFMINIKKKMTKNEFEALYDISLKDWFKKANIPLELQKFLIMVSSSIQVNPFPERSSSGELLHNIRRVMELGSVYYPKGGWNSIFSNFINQIKENDGEIKTNSAVNQIIIENNIAKGILIDNDLIEAEFIISTVPVQQLFTIVKEEHCNNNFINQCKNLKPTAGVSIDFCLSKKISKINGIIFFDKPLAFGFIPSNLSPEIVPKNCSLMSFFTVTDVEVIKNKNKITEIHRDLRDTIIKHFPEIENYLIHERPLFHEMVDGVEVNINQHTLKRPSNFVIGTTGIIKNLFITGDSVGGEGSGGDIGHTSVRNCFKEIIKT